MATTVVNIKRGEACDVYIGRGPGGHVATRPGERGYFGSPFPMNGESDRARVVQVYRAYFAHRIESDPTFRDSVLKLRGKRLGCWCHPAACHGDVIAAWLDSEKMK